MIACGYRVGYLFPVFISTPTALFGTIDKELEKIVVRFG